jgi:hypothetical protein
LLACVPSLAAGSSQGYSYSRVAGDVQPGQACRYWLHAVDAAQDIVERSLRPSSLKLVWA